MSSTENNQDVAARARAGAVWVQERTILAKEQLTPLARSALLNANRGVYQARLWAAPRVELAGVTVQERVAPAVSSAMVNAARAIQVEEPRRRRRWPGIVAGLITIAAGCVAAVLLRGQRSAQFGADPADPPPPVPPASGTTGNTEMTDAQVDGQVRTP